MEADPVLEDAVMRMLHALDDYLQRQQQPESRSS